MIKRWVMDSDYRRRDPRGGWVRYKDHAAEIKRLRLAVDIAAKWLDKDQHWTRTRSEILLAAEREEER